MNKTVVNDVWLEFVTKIDGPITEILRGGECSSEVYAGVQYPASMFDLRDAIRLQAEEHLGDQHAA